MYYIIFSLLVSWVAAWITHVFWSIKILSSSVGPTVGQIALGVLGAFCPPIGSIHGFMIWFGIGF